MRTIIVLGALSAGAADPTGAADASWGSAYVRVITIAGIVLLVLALLFARRLREARVFQWKLEKPAVSGELSAFGITMLIAGALALAGTYVSIKESKVAAALRDREQSIDDLKSSVRDRDALTRQLTSDLERLRAALAEARLITQPVLLVFDGTAPPPSQVRVIGQVVREGEHLEPKLLRADGQAFNAIRVFFKDVRPNDELSAIVEFGSKQWSSDRLIVPNAQVEMRAVP